MILNDPYFDILEKIDEEQKKNSPNMANLRSGNLGLDMKRYAVGVAYLQECGLIKDAVLQEGGDEPGAFWASLDSASITPLGKQILESKRTINPSI